MVNNENYNELSKTSVGYVRGHFDGIKFLWKTPETHFFLKIIFLLFTSMIIYFVVFFFLLLIFRDSIILLRVFGFSHYVFVGFFVYIVLELVVFYLSARKHKFFPEKNKYLTLIYWSSAKGGKKSKISHIIFAIGGIILSIILMVLDWFVFLPSIQFLPISYGLSLTTYFSVLFIMFILAFFTIKGSMESYESNYSEKFMSQKAWYFLLFITPWILLFINSYYLGPFWRSGLLEMGPFMYFYVLIDCGILGVIGLTALFKDSIRVGFTVSYISVLLTFTFVVLIPAIVGSIVDFLGSIVSFIFLIYFFMQGTLDSTGDELHNYYLAWENKLNKFKIFSEEDFRTQNYDSAFHTTPLDTDVPNAYRNLLLGLFLLTFTFFALIFNIGSHLAILGAVEAFEDITATLFLVSIAEIFGFLFASVIFTILIVYRQTKKHSKVKGKRPVIRPRAPAAYQPTPQPVTTSTVRSMEQPRPIPAQTMTCPHCNQVVPISTFCVQCGKKIAIQCPYCNNLVKEAAFCTDCGKKIT